MFIAYAAESFDVNDVGFVHAVGLAARTAAPELLTLHVTQGSALPTSWPRATELLSRWGVASAISERVYECPGHDDVADELIAVCLARRPQLLVMPTHARQGLSRLFAGSVAEAVARNLKLPSLLLPLGGSGIVAADSGKLQLSRALVLAGAQADAQLGVDAAAWFLQALGVTDGELTLLHAEDGTPAPEVQAPAGVRVSSERHTGPLEHAVTEVVKQRAPELVVAVSHGHDELRDVFGSSHTERVLHVARRPLLWIPADYRPGR
jgi:nucleotide-binding universal stress UspA family protein